MFLKLDYETMQMLKKYCYDFEQYGEFIYGEEIERIILNLIDEIKRLEYEKEVLEDAKNKE